MKKVLAILIAAAMLFACVGCGEEPVENTQTTTTEMEMTTNTDTEDTAQDNSASSTSLSSQKSQKTSTTKVTTTTSEKASKSKTSKFLTASYRRYKKYITVRGGMKNTGYKIANDLELKVAFMGGSVTAGMGSSDNHKGGFRGFFFHEMRNEYLAAKFTQIGSTLGGNGSQYGVYITEQMIATQKPDLVFIEYAINNAYDGVKEADKLWNHYETMIHTIYKHNPYADIVFLYVSDQRESDKDIIPIVEEIAEKYQLTSINLHQAILDYMEGQGLKWSHYYGDSVHCNDNGYQLMGKILHGAVQYAMSTSPYTYAKLPCPAPKGTIQSEAKAVAATSCTIPAGWKKSTDFSYEDSLFGGSIQTTETGKTITVKFKGTHFGVLVEFAENAGILEYSVDGGEYQQLDCYLENYSNPKARMLAENVENKEHTITMRMSKRSHMAIAAYLLNGTIISVS